MCFRYTGVASGVVVTAYAIESAAGKQRRNVVCLIVTVFKQEPTVAVQVQTGATNDQAQGIQPVRAAGERATGLKSSVTFPEMRIGIPNVGRIADDNVESAIGKWIEPVARNKFDI